MKREWRLDVKCTEPGCTEVARYSYETKRDMVDSFERRHAPKWKCSTHSNPTRNVTMAQKFVEWTSQPSRQESHGRYWGNSGILIHGAFYAKAEDFPVGTTIRITCEAFPPVYGLDCGVDLKTGKGICVCGRCSPVSERAPHL